MTAVVATVSNESLSNDKHDIPHSKVIHCRAVPDGCRESDVVNAMRVFGNVQALRLIPKKNQALVEFQAIESAIACVTYNSISPVRVCGCNIGVNYSKSAEIMRHFQESGQTEIQPTHIVLMTIINVLHPVDVDVIKKICKKQKAEVQRIVFFHKNGLQALVEFENVEEAINIQQNLNGCDIYPGCCRLKIEYSLIDKLNVRSNTSETYNIDLCNENTGYDSSTNNLIKKMNTLLGDNENLAAVQNIILKVLSGGTMDSNTPSSLTSAKCLLPNSNRTPLLSSSDDCKSLLQNAANNQRKHQQHSISQYPGMVRTLDMGGAGCVAMVYGVNNEILNCNHLFNLFCMYGNVIKIKILTNKPGCAMVQYASKLSTTLALQHLNDLTIFGQQFRLSVSKHPYIADAATCPPLFDQSPSVVNFVDNLNNRFNLKSSGSRLGPVVHPASKVLHYFNAPPECSQEQLYQLFDTYKADCPVKHITIPKPNSRSSLGLIEFPSIDKAVEAAMLVNHVTLRKNDGNMESADAAERGRPFTLKLAFSASDSIN